MDALLTLMTIPEVKSRVYNIASGNVVVDKMVAHVKKIIPSASFSYTPAEDIMVVISGFKEWTIDCSRAAKEIGWQSSYTVEKMAEDIISQIRSS